MSPDASIRSLLLVWLGLLLLLGLSTASAFVPLGAGNALLILLIALVKIGLIVHFFMHLNRSDAAVRLAASATLLFLFFMAFLTFGDLLTRHLASTPWQAPAESPDGPYGSAR